MSMYYLNTWLLSKEHFCELNQIFLYLSRQITHQSSQNEFSNKKVAPSYTYGRDTAFPFINFFFNTNNLLFWIYHLVRLYDRLWKIILKT